MTASRHSFRKAAESWLSESAGGVSEKTIEHYRWVLERFVFPNIEGSLEITGEEVEKLVEGIRKDGLSESTLYEIPTVGNEFKKAMAALDRIVAKEENPVFPSVQSATTS